MAYFFYVATTKRLDLAETSTFHILNAQRPSFILHVPIVPHHSRNIKNICQNLIKLSNSRTDGRSYVICHPAFHKPFLNSTLSSNKPEKPFIQITSILHAWTPPATELQKKEVGNAQLLLMETLVQSETNFDKNGKYVVVCWKQW